MTKVKLLNNSGYLGFGETKFPLIVNAEKCESGYFVGGSEFIKLDIHCVCISGDSLYFTENECEVIYD